MAVNKLDTAELREMEAKAMAENALLANVLRAAGANGWRAVHFRPARIKRKNTQGKTEYRTAVQGPGAKGFPDVVLVKGDTLLFRELKTEKGRMANDQLDWLVELQRAGQDAGTWRPIDWLDGTIDRELGIVR